MTAEDRDFYDVLLLRPQGAEEVAVLRAAAAAARRTAKAAWAAAAAHEEAAGRADAAWAKAAWAWAAAAWAASDLQAGLRRLAPEAKWEEVRRADLLGRAADAARDAAFARAGLRRG